MTFPKQTARPGLSVLLKRGEWATGIPVIWGPGMPEGGLPSASRTIALHWPDKQLVPHPQQRPPQQKGFCVPCAHTLGPSLSHSGCGDRALPRLSPSSPGARWLPPRPAPGPALSPPPARPGCARAPLCCPGLFVPGARRGPGARSRALVTTSRRAAPGAPAQPIGRPGAGAARGGAGKPISCSESCTTTKGPGRSGGRQGSDRSAGAGAAAATSASAAPLGSRKCGRRGREGGGWVPAPRLPCRALPTVRSRRHRGPAGHGKPAPLPQTRPAPPDPSASEPAPAGRALPVTARPSGLITGTWGVSDCGGFQTLHLRGRDRPVRPRICSFKRRKLGDTEIK